jgi:hypothetical protein
MLIGEVVFVARGLFISLTRSQFATNNTSRNICCFEDGQQKSKDKKPGQ